MKQPKVQLEEELKRLNESAKKIVETRGYTKEVDKIKMLEELIREQLANENTLYTARTSR